MIGNRFYTWFKNYYQWVGGAFNETLLLPLVRATQGLRAGAIRYDETTDTVETYDGENWNAIPSASGFVPYTGASQEVNLGEQGLEAGYVQLDTTPTSTPEDQGTMYWDADAETIALIMNGTVQKVGEDVFFHVQNKTGQPIPKGSCVRFDGTDGNSGKILIAPFIANGSYPSQYFMGVTAETIAHETFGKVYHFGKLRGVNTQAFNAGDILYASTTVAGGFQTTAPVAPNNIIIVAAVISKANNGVIMIRSTLGSNINTDEGVLISGAANNQGLFYDNGLWRNKSIATVLGYTPGTVSSVGVNTSTNGVTVSGSPITVSGTIGVDIATASGSQNGLLSSTDWSTFNNKINLTSLSAGTGISYDNTTGVITNTAPDQTVSITASGTTSVSGTYPNFTISSADQFNGTVTSVGLVTGSTGTDINVSGSPVTSSGSITLNIPDASATNRGALTSTDWSTFNAKQAALTLTTTGNSGASTLVGATLNIPEYTASGLGAVPTSRTLTINGTALDLSANRSWSVGTVTSVGLTSATSGVTISDSPVTVSGTIGIAIATANGSQQGLLSSTDWTTFNNKQATLSLTTSGTSGAATLVGATLNVPEYQAQGNYITSLTGEATASGPGAASVTLGTTAVTGKLLTGLNLAGGGTIASTDSILVAFGKVQNQISAMMGGVTFQGVWNANTNTPTLTSSTGTKGHYYIVDVSGTTNLNGITDWRVGDWAIFNGSTWDKVDNTDAVSSVNGYTGAVSLVTTDIAEGTNLYYTDTRSRTAISLTTSGSSGAATYDNVSGVINVPQYTLSGLGGVPTTRQITINGTAFDLSADRTYSVGTVTSVGLSTTTTGVTIGNTPVTGSGTITVNIATASGSQQGLLSSTDWSTFNNKQNALTNPVTGTGTTGQVAYFNGTTTITSESNLFWDAANDRLGIGKNNPTSTLDVVGGGFFTSNVTARAFYAVGDNSTTGGFFALPQFNSANFGGATYTSLYALGTTTFGINFNQGASIRNAEFSATSISNNTTRQYVLPNASGTLALTSDISSAVSGTTNTIPKFTGASTIGNSQIFDNGTSVIVNGSTSSDARFIANGNSSGYAAYFSQPSIYAGYYRLIRYYTNGNVVLDIGSINGTNIGLVNNQNDTMYFGTNGQQHLTIFGSGNLFVGTSPSDNGARLQVSGAGTFSSSVTSNNGSLGIFSSGASARLVLQTNGVNKFDANSTQTEIADQAGTSVLYLKSGNVGIGTSTPARKLIVYDTDANVPTIGLRTDGSGTTDSDGFDLQFTSSNTFLFNRESGYMAFGTSNTERMRITSGGAVEMTGTIQTGAPSGGTAVPWLLGGVSQVAFTPTKSVRVEINGTVYFLQAISADEI